MGVREVKGERGIVRFCSIIRWQSVSGQQAWVLNGDNVCSS